jgi:hypothetical protein
MRREEAEAQRERLQQDDHEHTFFVREQAGEWEVVRTNIPQPISHYAAAGRGPASPTTDAEQTAEDGVAARRLKALRERRARLANVPSEPATPPPYVVVQPPGFGY